MGDESSWTHGLCRGPHCTHAEDVVRRALPGNDPFPIAAAVTVRAGVDTVYVSGALPSPINKEAPKGTPTIYSDMEARTVSVMSSIGLHCRVSASEWGTLSKCRFSRWRIPPSTIK